jgi:predicted membrane-bound mannosyltransferase
LGPDIRTDGPTHSRTIAALFAIAIAYSLLAGYAVLYGRAWTDEATYVVKSWWYVNGLVPPYTDQDATWYMPLFFYQLGLFEKLFGTSLAAARIMSMVIGGLSGGLLFLICRRLTGNPMAAAFAVALYLLNPTTAYYFATGTPLATVACLMLLAVWLMLNGIDRPRLWISAASACCSLRCSSTVRT